MPEIELNKIKLDFLDLALIRRKTVRNPSEIKELEGVDIKNLFYKSNKITLSGGKIYPSKAAWKNNLPIETADSQVCPVINSSVFWKELDYHYYLTEE